MGAEVFAVVVFVGLALAVGIGAMVLSELLGPKRRDPEKNTPYECGVPILGSARQPFNVNSISLAAAEAALDDDEHVQRSKAINAQGMAVLMATHDLGQVRRLADEVLFLHRGRLLEQTSVETMFAGAESAAARAFVAGELFW